jgi:DNA-binding transcriptional MerR regulator
MADDASARAEQRLAATPARAAAVAGASIRQVEYWRKTGLVTPVLARRLSEQNEVRLYNFTDLIELRVVGELRKRGLSLQHIRAVVRHLRTQ